MPEFLFVVFTEPVSDREGEYNDWYDNEHLADVLRVAGIRSARRYKLVETEPAQTGVPQYLALYEIEADDTASVSQGLEAAMANGEMILSPALDTERVTANYYEPITD